MDSLPATPVVGSPSDAFFLTLFTLSLTGVLLLQPVWDDTRTNVQDFAYVRINPVAQRLLRLPEYPHTTMLTRYPYAGPTEVFAFYREAFYAGQPRRLEVPYAHDDIDAHFWVAAQRTGDYLVVSFTDVAEFDQLAPPPHPAPTPVAEPYRQLQDLVRQAPLAIGIFQGPDHVGQLANGRYQALVGSRPLLGRPLREAVPELLAYPLFGWLDAVYRTGQPLVGQELVVPPTPPATATTHLTLTLQPTHDAAGHVAGVMVFAADTTAQAHSTQHLRDVTGELALLNLAWSAIEQQFAAATSQLASSQQQVSQLTYSFDARVRARTLGLEAANEQLTRTNQDLDTFVYSASHDLRAPIANLEGLLYELDRTVATDPARHADLAPLLTLLHGTVQRFQQTIGHLTDISRVAQTGDPGPEPVDVATVVAGVQLDLAPLIAETGARVVVEIGGCAPLRLPAKHLRSLVYNLLSNALKYRHPDRVPEVQLCCQTTATTVELIVQDNGLGLSPEQQVRLFALFRRLHHHVEGSGVGLYLSKKMVENAGGTLTVQSQAGVGSTFTAALPLS